MKFAQINKPNKRIIPVICGFLGKGKNDEITTLGRGGSDITAFLIANCLDAEEIITLAKLPSREELIAKLAGVLLANISKLAVALDQVKAKKEQE